jgi:hypothetical protein
VGLKADSRNRRVVARFREDEGNAAGLEQPTSAIHESRHATDTRLTHEQIGEVMWKRGFPYKDGEVSPRMAEMRADLGSAIYKDYHMAQTFDGPAPETINGRLAMLGVVTGLVLEATTGQGLLQQTADHPVIVLASFVLFSIATYAPIFKGYTRKEPFANGPWTPTAENWNGRVAMLGFTGMILTELIAGCNTLQAWGLQPHHLGH